MDRKIEIVSMKHCRGDSCHQGRLPCQTPQACEVAEEDDEFERDYVGLVLLVIVLTCVFGMVWIFAR